MRVRVNTAILGRGVSGSARYTRSFIGGLEAAPGVEVVAAPGPYDASRRRLLRGAQWLWWDWVGSGIARPRCDLLVSPVNFAPVVSRSPVWAIMYDTMVLDHKGGFDPRYRAVAQVGYRVTARSADLIVAPSHYSKERLTDRLNIRAPVEVIPTSLSQDWFATSSRIAPAGASLLMVGATEPHKRVHLGIEAAALARDMLQGDLTLGVIGPEGRDEQNVQRTMRLVDPGGVWTRRYPHVSSEELRMRYRKADLFLHTSSEEGFGIPLIEAAACGVPVVHAGGSAVQEILQPAVDGTDALAICLAEAIRDLITDSDAYANASKAVLSLAKTRYSEAAVNQSIEQLLLKYS